MSLNIKMIFQSNQTAVFGLKETKKYISMTHDLKYVTKPRKLLL